MTRPPLSNFANRMAIVLHDSADVRANLSDRLERLGMRAVAQSGELLADAFEADVIIIDIDRAYDDQLPWEAGQAAVPMIGLVGSESPGRLAWALKHEIDAYLPLSALGNIFSALVIAHATFERKAEQRDRETAQTRVQAGRLDVVRAVLRLMEDCGDEALALKKLRAFAMVERMTIEEAARTVLAGRRDLRSQRS